MQVDFQSGNLSEFKARREQYAYIWSATPTRRWQATQDRGRYPAGAAGTSRCCRPAIHSQDDATTRKQNASGRRSATSGVVKCSPVRTMLVCATPTDLRRIILATA